MTLPKVCHILHLDGAGGGPVVVRDHLAASAGNAELSVICGGSGMITEYCEGHGIPHWRVAMDRKRDLPLGFIQIVQALKKAAPDIAILHGQWAGPVAAPALRLAGVEKSIYMAGWPAFYADWDLFRVIRNRIAEEIPCRMCDRVVLLSAGNWHQYTMRKLAPPAKMRVIPNGIDLTRVPSREAVERVRKEEGWDDGNCHVVSVGRLADQKRLDWLLESWRLVQEAEPAARLSIIGEGDEEPGLRELAHELNIERTCTFLGSRASGIEYVAASDIVAMTTLFESFGLVALEAMACGRPVVVNDVDGPRDCVDNGVQGFLVRPGDIKAFADRLLMLIRDQKLRLRMGEAGVARAQEYALPITMKMHHDLIDEVLAEPVK